MATGGPGWGRPITRSGAKRRTAAFQTTRWAKTPSARTDRFPTPAPPGWPRRPPEIGVGSPDHALWREAADGGVPDHALGEDAVGANGSLPHPGPPRLAAAPTRDRGGVARSRALARSGGRRRSRPRAGRRRRRRERIASPPRPPPAGRGAHPRSGWGRPITRSGAKRRTAAFQTTRWAKTPSARTDRFPTPAPPGWPRRPPEIGVGSPDHALWREAADGGVPDHALGEDAVGANGSLPHPGPPRLAAAPT